MAYFSKHYQSSNSLRKKRAIISKNDELRTGFIQVHKYS